MRINNIDLLILIKLDCALIVVILLRDNSIVIDYILVIVNCASIELN